MRSVRMMVNSKRRTTKVRSPMLVDWSIVGRLLLLPEGNLFREAR